MLNSWFIDGLMLNSWFIAGCLLVSWWVIGDGQLQPICAVNFEVNSQIIPGILRQETLRSVSATSHEALGISVVESCSFMHLPAPAQCENVFTRGAKHRGSPCTGRFHKMHAQFGLQRCVFHVHKKHDFLCWLVVWGSYVAPDSGLWLLRPSDSGCFLLGPIAITMLNRSVSFFFWRTHQPIMVAKSF